jgi:enoyl-CoA hydratase/carnithine racemase
MIGSYVARRIGSGRTREWALTAERIDAATALAWGLVSTVVPAARVASAEVRERIESFKRPSGRSPR